MIEQRSEEWHRQRAGKVTASRFADAISMKEVGRAPNKTLAPTDTRSAYMREIVAAILSGEPKAEINSFSLQWGRDAEPYARQAYEIETGFAVIDSEFIAHPVHDFVGCSPDGLVGADGGIEMKCPKDPGIHIRTLAEGMPDEHIGQVQGCMFVTGRQWWDFVSYDPRQDEPYRLYIQRIERDELYIQRLESGLWKFWQDVQSYLALIKRNVA